MKRIILITSAVCAVGLIAIIVGSHAVSAQDEHGKKKEKQPAAYNTYPPGILPSDLDSEIFRVRSEVVVIENEALAQWGALTPPTLTGQPPTLQGTGQRANQLLGKLMNFDENMSPFRDSPAVFCHMPYAGFSGSAVA